MTCTYYRDNELYIENVSLKEIAKQFGTPLYIYSQTTLSNRWHDFAQALSGVKHRICYAVKANSNLSLLRLLAQFNSGFDIVSGGELARVIKAGGNPQQTIFSGVGKTVEEIEFALANNIYCFDVESAAELDRLQAITAARNCKVNIALRINPNINANTHSYIATGLRENKFGIMLEEIIPLCQKIKQSPTLNLLGLACHIGSQLTKLEPFSLVIDTLLDCYQQLKAIGITLHHLNIGGGLGIIYHDEVVPSITEYAVLLQKKFAGYPLEIILEPGRSIVGNAGVLLTQIEYLKHTTHKNFAIVDAGMNDLLRPALYQAWQAILPVEKRALAKTKYDIVGPVCESSDILGHNRELALCAGDLLCIESAGAYGFSMSSNYNSRCRPAEILVHGEQMQIIRRRETPADLMALEL